VTKWFGCELGAQTSYEDKPDSGVKSTVMGAHDTPKLQELLDKFLTVYVLCPTCGLPEMDLQVNQKKQEIGGKCAACGFNGFLEDATGHRMAAFVFKNPPDGQGASNGPKKLTKEQRKELKAAKQRGEAEDDGKKKKKKAAGMKAVYAVVVVGGVLFITIGVVSVLFLSSRGVFLAVFLFDRS